MNRRDWRDQNETSGHGAQGDYGRDDGGRQTRDWRTEGDRGPDEVYGGAQGYGPYRRDDARGERGGFDPYRENYYGLPGGFYGGIPGGYAGRDRYDRGAYADRDLYGSNRGYRHGQGGYDEDRGFFSRAADEVSSWFGDEDAERRREQDHRGRGPKNYQRSEVRLQEDVCDRLTDDDTLDASEITVQVKDCEVTLDGSVTSRYAKRRAEDCADSVSGVQHVQNNLRVQGMDAMSSASTQTTTGRQT